jgi:hypothetical protein
VRGTTYLGGSIECVDLEARPEADPPRVSVTVENVSEERLPDLDYRIRLHASGVAVWESRWTRIPSNLAPGERAVLTQEIPVRSSGEATTELLIGETTPAERASASLVSAGDPCTVNGRAPTGLPLKLSPGDVVRRGATLETGAGNRITMDDSSLLRVGEFRTDPLGSDRRWFRTESGAALGTISGTTVVVVPPCTFLMASGRRAEFFVKALGPNCSEIASFAGGIAISGLGYRASLDGGQGLRIEMTSARSASLSTTRGSVGTVVFALRRARDREIELRIPGDTRLTIEPAEEGSGDVIRSSEDSSGKGVVQVRSLVDGRIVGHAELGRGGHIVITHPD